MTSKSKDDANGGSSFYEEEENLQKLCDFLRSAEGPAVREAIEMEKRVYYLKGELYMICRRHGVSVVYSCVRFVYVVSVAIISN